MKKRILVLALLVVVALALTATIVFAELGLPETSTRTNGETTVTWDSSFEDLDYNLGDIITMTVKWNVDVGDAEYVSFDLGSGSFTPRSRQDPVNGEIVTEAVQTGDNSVTIEFQFTGLHTCPVPNVEMGNAHFKLYLKVDMDGDGEPDKVVSYGVNVHVEEPQ